MAEEKKGFLLYADYLKTVGKLPDAKAGKLFKIILEYVNDLNPVVDDLLLEVAFEPIKQQLKRDLANWQDKKEKRVEAGKKGGVKSGETRRNKSGKNKRKSKQTEANEATLQFASKNEANEAVIVNGNVSVNVKERENTPTPALQPESGWNTKPTEAEIKLPLPAIKVGAVQQLFAFSKNLNISPAQVEIMWGVFKVQNFTGEKFYQSENQVYSHFINWCKTQSTATVEQTTKATGTKTNYREEQGNRIMNEVLGEN